MQAEAFGTPNVEFRTGDHYMVLPPSVLADGSAYEWLAGHAPGEIPLADLPHGWVDALEAHKPKAATGARDSGEVDRILTGRRSERLKNSKLPEFEPILAGCAWLRGMKENPTSQSEPEWYAALGIVGRCADGNRLAHAFSQDYAGYSSTETEAKLQQALKSSGPRTCASIESAHCASCIFRHNKAEGFGPLDLGRCSVPLVETLKDAVYVIETGHIIDIRKNSALPLRFFAAGVQFFSRITLCSNC